MMNVTSFDIDGLILLEPNVFGDERGYFFECYSNSKYSEYLGQNVRFVQDNESKSSKGVLRGLHFQKPPFAQAKLVRVIQGEVLDIAVDLRHESKTYGKYQSVLLSGTNKNQFFVPHGFAHGFVVLSDEAIFAYKVDNVYAPEYDSGIRFDDPDLGIDWNIPEVEMIVSDKDLKQLSFSNYSSNPIF